ncbi:flagellar motor protein MotP [Thermosipho melanesiensis]|uniref:MotA/TolQ/ExbB proton channel n=2 Tax=Thermosipho melanesiensis TaxID=46541 RepID=A6LMJ3_THEM4|nr:motility protein A [Thermosipho melanesiensis]ABR31144.1 MotA/TolQ/ExbB proton channel [Thermosipho melanesiensis BI429]APT74234.1 flagellar motor protein MotP [Thermosipho melanesiensis]OOC36176.1 flagellar motor protein MotP [Thermosipho melanesiensis]OOC36994.1 flagellar motor protein MotP [Thermosipho melanesiensis]OOC37746.1 flagellar motor protein MotP [Thermosipho melanesiensis]
MDIALLGGVGLAFVMVIYGIISGGGDFAAFINIPSIVIVIGGSIGAAVAANPKDIAFKFVQVTLEALKEPKTDYVNLLRTLVSLSEKARREGLLSLEENIEQLDDPFMKKGLQLLVDGTEPEVLKSMMEIEIEVASNEMNLKKGLFEAIGAYAPAFGMIGTLIGLIQMLKSLNDPNSLGPSMAVALITTLYGSIMANAFALPIAEKMGKRVLNTELEKNMILEGILSIQAGENPRILEEKLKAFLPQAAKAQYEASTQEANA